MSTAPTSPVQTRNDATLRPATPPRKKAQPATGRPPAPAAGVGSGAGGNTGAGFAGFGFAAEVAPSSILIPAPAVDWLSDTLGDGPSEVEQRITELLPPAGVPEVLLTALDTKLAEIKEFLAPFSKKIKEGTAKRKAAAAAKAAQNNTSSAQGDAASQGDNAAPPVPPGAEETK